jgi:hypothetical protein
MKRCLTSLVIRENANQNCISLPITERELARMQRKQYPHSLLVRMENGKQFGSSSEGKHL